MTWSFTDHHSFFVRGTSKMGKDEMLKSMSSIGFFDSEMAQFKASVNLSSSSLFESKEEVLELYHLVQEDQALRNNEYLRMKNPAIPKKQNDLTAEEMVFNIKLAFIVYFRSYNMKSCRRKSTNFTTTGSSSQTGIIVFRRWIPFETQMSQNLNLFSSHLVSGWMCFLGTDSIDEYRLSLRKSWIVHVYISRS